MNKNIALITGITGQDGPILLNFFKKVMRFMVLKEGLQYLTPIELSIFDFIIRIFILHYGDMTDSKFNNVIAKTKPTDEIYNLAAQSHVQVSFEDSRIYCELPTVLGTIKNSWRQ